MAVRGVRRNKSNILVFYDVVFTTIPVGVAFELNNPSNSGKIILFQKMSLRGGSSFTINIERRSTPNSGGTSVALSGRNAFTDGDTPIGTSAIYTLAPTPGTLIDSLIRTALTTAVQEINLQNGNGQDEGIVILPGQTLNVVSNLSTSLQGFFQTREITI